MSEVNYNQRLLQLGTVTGILYSCVTLLNELHPQLIGDYLYEQLGIEDETDDLADILEKMLERTQKEYAITCNSNPGGEKDD